MTPTQPGETPSIRTSSDDVLDLIDPDPSTITLNDLILGCVRVARWSGQLPLEAGSFSVLEHSIHCYELQLARGITDPEVLYQTLMHDVHEGLIGDKARPVKIALRILSGTDHSAWDELEDRMENAVRIRFKIPTAHKPVVKQVDTLAQTLERSAFYGDPIPDEAAGFALPTRYEAIDAIARFQEIFDELVTELRLELV